jgi:hypothetical protein
MVNWGSILNRFAVAAIFQTKMINMTGTAVGIVQAVIAAS